MCIFLWVMGTVSISGQGSYNFQLVLSFMGYALPGLVFVVQAAGTDMHGFVMLSQVLCLQGLCQMPLGPWPSQGRLHSTLLFCSSYLAS